LGNADIQMKRLQSVQNTAAGSLSISRRRSYITPILHSLHEPQASEVGEDHVQYRNTCVEIDPCHRSSISLGILCVDRKCSRSSPVAICIVWMQPAAEILTLDLMFVFSLNSTSGSTILSTFFVSRRTHVMCSDTLFTIFCIV